MILGSANKSYTNNNTTAGDGSGVFVKFDIYTQAGSTDSATISFGNRSIDLDLGAYSSGETHRVASDGVYSNDEIYAEIDTTTSGSYLKHTVEMWMPSYTQATSEFIVTKNSTTGTMYLDNVDVDYTNLTEFNDVNNKWLVDLGDADKEAATIRINDDAMTAGSLSSGWQFMSGEMEQLAKDMVSLNKEIKDDIEGTTRVFGGESLVSDGEMASFVNQISSSLDTWNSSSGAPGLDQRSELMWRLVHTDSSNAFDTVATPFDGILLASTALFAVSSGFAVAGAASAISAASAATGAAGSAGFLTNGIVGVATQEVSSMTQLPTLDIDTQMGLDTFIFIEQEITERVLQGGNTQGLAAARGNFLSVVNEAYDELEDFVANVALMNLLSQQGKDHLSEDTKDIIRDLGFEVAREQQQTGTRIFRQEITSGESELQADAVRWVFKDPVGSRRDSVRIEVNPLGEEGWL